MNKTLEALGPLRIKDYAPPVSKVFLHAVMVCLATLISLHLVSQAGHVAALWLCNGITLGVLIVSPKRLWASCLLTGATANVLTVLANNYHPLLACSMSACNVCEILVAATAVYRPDRPAHHFTDRASAVRMAVAFIVAPAVSAVLAAILRYELIDAPILETIQTWYLAHGIGLAVVTPLTLTALFKDFGPMLRQKELPRTAAVLLTLLVVTTFVFSQTKLPLLFCVFPPLALIVFQLGFPGMTLGIFMLALETSYFTIIGTGPLSLMRDATLSQRVLMAQCFTLVSVSMALPIAIALTERKRLEQRLRSAQEQLRQLAATDQLTGLANRRMFDEFMEREWKRALREKKPLCAIMIDIDCFKSYNDRYGHQAGDECLKAVAAGLAEVIRRPGDLVARYGGEEFVVLLPHTALDGGQFVAEQVRRKIESLQLVHAGASDGRVTISLGVEMAEPDANVASQTLIAAADALLYAAKHNGRNCVMTRETAPAVLQKVAANG